MFSKFFFGRGLYQHQGSNILDLNEINTPALLIDLDVMEANIRKLSEHLRGKKCGYRPHAKAHKSPFIAHKQIRAGAGGIACQTMDEAEVMGFNGIPEILLTHMIVTPDKIRRLVNLAKHTKVMVTVDCAENVKALASAASQNGVDLGVMVEIDVGQKRTGVPPLKPVLELTKVVQQNRGVTFRGIMGYEGHLQCSIPEFEERKRKCLETLTPVTETRDLLLDAGLPVEIVSSGGTGTYNITCDVPGVTEIQPGSYVIMDGRYRLIQTCGSDFGCALSVLATVVSKPTSTRVIVDMGWKACSVEYQIFGWQGMPQPKSLSGVEYWVGGDEHGVLTIKDSGLKLNLGDKIEFIPSHCDTTVNLHDRFYGMRNGQVELVCDIPARRRAR